MQPSNQAMLKPCPKCNNQSPISGYVPYTWLVQCSNRDCSFGIKYYDQKSTEEQWDNYPRTPSPSPTPASNARRDAIKEVVDKAWLLINRMEKVYNDHRYQYVWQCYANHGGDYSNGPTWEKEFNDLKDILSLLITER